MAGYFGKVPSRGDFVRLDLSESFVAPWFAWMQAMLAASQTLLGEAWRPAWMEAPVWRFVLSPGQCGPDAVLGLWMPSIDRAGRCFPLTIAALSAVVAPPGDAGVDEWLDRAEDAGRAAIADDLSPSDLAARLPDAPARAGSGATGSDTIEGGVWWTDGSPFVPAGRAVLVAMPDAWTFAAMIHAAATAGARVP